MRSYHPDNERLKRRYLQYLREAKGASISTCDAVAAAIDRFQVHCRGKPFAKFHIEQAQAFKRHLEAAINPRTSKPLSASTRASILNHLKAFFLWLADQPGLRSRIRYSDCDYFSIDNRSKAIAKGARSKRYPSLAQIEHTLKVMPCSSPIEQRDRALLAFTLLTCARVSALRTAQICHVDLAEQVFHQDARVVRTKFAKTFDTWFFPVSDLALHTFSEYHAMLTRDLLFGPSDPLFPKTLIEHVPGKGFAPTGLTREPYAGTQPIARIFKQAFALAGLETFSPHRFRDTLADIGKQHCTTLQQYQAWGQNLGHEDVTTTLHSYGPIAPQQQRDIIRAIRLDE